MHHKKSMRIFWLSLSLLLVSGVAIITVVQINSHKKVAERQQEAVHDENGSTEVRQDALPESAGAEAGRSAAESGSQVSADERQAQPVGRNLPEYAYELKADNGYLEVYYYHTKRLFFHTGIPERALTSTQREELSQGKYFRDEQELYGYLESCTS